MEIVEEVDSTNRVLLERARAGAPEGCVLVADHQTAGRGRLDRSWESPPGASLLASVLVRPGVPVHRAHLFTFAAGLAATDACRAAAGVDARVKWPNDVVVEDRKLAGLLAQLVIADGEVEACVIGMGLNVNWQEDELPPGATALSVLAGREVSRDAVLDRWLASLSARLGDMASMLDDYRRRSATIGRQVRVELDGTSVEGVASDVTDDGHLVVGGRTFAVADVVHLRPA